MANIKPYLKIILLLLFLLAALFGLSRQTAFHLFGQNELPSTRPLARSTQPGNGSFDDYYNAGNQIAAATNGQTTATFLAAGDIMLSRDVARQMAVSKDPSLPFRQAGPLLAGTDFNFANLESPFSGSDVYSFNNQYIFNAPRFAMDGLRSNFQIVTTANNHAFDQGKTGIDYTLSALAKNGIASVGTGNDLDEAWAGKIMTANGIKIGFIGASYTPSNTGIPNDNVALLSDTKRLAASVSALKQQADFVVVAMHAGVEYSRVPSSVQVNFAHIAIDDGADMVIGAHPHWIQPIEQYRGKYIFYSLGNFVFDQGFSQNTREGLTLKITLNQDKAGLTGLKQVELDPVIIDHNCCPRPATADETRVILSKINQPDNIIFP